MLIPYQELQADTLRALIEEFVTRDGAVQGHHDTPMDQKIALVMKQLKSGEVAIVFDPDDETCTIVPKNTLGGMKANDE